MGKNWYQRIRTQVKQNLRHVVEYFGMEYAIRASTPRSVAETERALREHLAGHGFHVVHETDVREIHNHYKIAYPEFKILKVASAETFEGCSMARAAIERDPTSSVFLPPGIAVYEMNDRTYVSAVRPSTLLAVFTDPEIREVLVELEGVLWNALEEGVPGSTMLSAEPPVAGDRRETLKRRLHLVLSLVDAEYHVEVSSPAPPRQVAETLRDSLGRRGQKVFGEVADGAGGTVLLVVNPGQAHKALAIDPDVAVFAPLSVSVREEDGRTHVRAVRPTTLLIFFAQPEMQEILMEMEMLLWNGIVTGVPDARVETRQPPLQPEGGQRTTAAGTAGTLGAMREDLEEEPGPGAPT